MSDDEVTWWLTWQRDRWPVPMKAEDSPPAKALAEIEELREALKGRTQSCERCDRQSIEIDWLTAKGGDPAEVCDDPWVCCIPSHRDYAKRIEDARAKYLSGRADL